MHTKTSSLIMKLVDPFSVMKGITITNMQYQYVTMKSHNEACHECETLGECFLLLRL